jgi:hypothetical protein
LFGLRFRHLIPARAIFFAKAALIIEIGYAYDLLAGWI